MSFKHTTIPILKEELRIIRMNINIDITKTPEKSLSEIQKITFMENAQILRKPLLKTSVSGKYSELLEKRGFSLFEFYILTENNEVKTPKDYFAS